MLVKTHPGQICPREDNRYITDDPTGVEVPDSVYYRRLVADGSLIVVSTESTKSMESMESKARSK